MGVYSEKPHDYLQLMKRLRDKLIQLETVTSTYSERGIECEIGIIYLGSMENTIQEIDDILESTGLKVSQCRLRALPAHSEIEKFIERHQTTIVLEINRDGQLYGILRKEIPIDLVPKLRSVAYSDGMPPRAQIYADMILECLKEENQ